MASEEFARATRGGGAAALSQAAASDAIETDNYREGGVFNDDGTGYNVSVDPAENIQELIIFECGNITMDLTLVGGSIVTAIELRGQPLVLDSVEIDSVTFKDPDGTTAALHGMWVGE